MHAATVITLQSNGSNDELMISRAVKTGCSTALIGGGRLLADANQASERGSRGEICSSAVGAVEQPPWLAAGVPCKAARSGVVAVRLNYQAASSLCLWCLIPCRDLTFTV